MGLVVRSSTKTKATSRAAPATQVAMTSGDDHALSGPSETPYMSEAEAGPAEDETRDVEAAGVVGRPCARGQRAPKMIGGDAEREVDEEDPAPGEVGHQEAAEHRSEGRRQRGRDGQDAGGPNPLGRGEDPEEHGHADRRQHAAACALEDPEDDELGHVLCQAAEHRPHGEDDDGDHEDPLPSEAVAQPARRRDEDGQADQVGDDDPVDRGRGDVEVTTDGGQGHVHDRDVHDVHEHG